MDAMIVMVGYGIILAAALYLIALGGEALVRPERTKHFLGEELEWVIAEGDFVAWRSRGKGTQTGAFAPFAPSGKQMDLVIIGMHRFNGGLIAETWTTWDNLAALMQLGHFPM